MYPHLTEDSEIFFEVGSDEAKYDGQNQGHLEWLDEGLNYAKSWGVGNITFLIPHQRVSIENILSIKPINVAQLTC